MVRLYALDDITIRHTIGTLRLDDRLIKELMDVTGASGLVLGLGVRIPTLFAGRSIRI